MAPNGERPALKPAKSIWFSSDTHFGHTNVIRYSNRPFLSIGEHDEILIQNWNSHVRSGDDVYFLGDFCYRNKEAASNIRKRLNGNIHFIEGNHDAAAHQIRHTFIWYKQLHDIKVGDRGIVLCHYAMRVWNKSHYGNWHLYGHSHNSLPDDPCSLSMDVGVDAVANRLAGNRSGGTWPNTKQADYRPLNVDEISAIMSMKTSVPIDHHGENHSDRRAA
jgi:calcineurin-like phosphoesterase family protein